MTNNHGKLGYEQAIRIAEVRRSKTLTDCAAVGDFSTVDRSVILTYDLRVLGFGAKIGVSSETPRAVRGDSNTSQAIRSTKTMSLCTGYGGTRHQSVARLKKPTRAFWRTRSRRTES